MVTTSTNCPVCKCENTTPIMDYMSNVKFAGRLEVHTDQSYSRCDRCGAVLHLPLEIFQSDEISIYGENYYCWGKDEREMIASHSEGQMHHYDKFHDFILEAFPAKTHEKWLDVGSSGYPTSFEDYEFTTIEPSLAAVAYGQETWNRDRIFNAVVETFETNTVFDGVVFLNSLYCTPTPSEAINNAYKRLRPGGALVVSIGNYLMETAAWSEDGRFSRIEDMWEGSTMWVYYNRLNLRSLCAQNGFLFKDDVIINKFDHHPHLEMRYLVFEKTTEKELAKAGAPSWQDCRQLTDRLLSDLISSFQMRTFESLANIDQSCVAIAGRADLISDMKWARPFSQVNTLVDCFAHEATDGFATLNDLCRKILENKIDTIAIAAINDLHTCLHPIISALAKNKLSPRDVRWLVPNRQSDLGRLFGAVLGSKAPTFALDFSICHVSQSPPGN